MKICQHENENVKNRRNLLQNTNSPQCDASDVTSNPQRNIITKKDTGLKRKDKSSNQLLMYIHKDWDEKGIVKSVEEVAKSSVTMWNGVKFNNTLLNAYFTCRS